MCSSDLRQVHRLRGEPYFVTRHLSPEYHAEQCQRIRGLFVQGRFDVMYVDGLTMAQYVMDSGLECPAIIDLHDSLSHQEGFHADECHYHFGLRDQHGRPKLLYRLWASGGFDAIEEIASLQRHHGAGLTRAPRVATLPPAVIVPVAEGGAADTMPSVSPATIASRSWPPARWRAGVKNISR